MSIFKPLRCAGCRGIVGRRSAGFKLWNIEEQRREGTYHGRCHAALRERLGEIAGRYQLFVVLPPNGGKMRPADAEGIQEIAGHLFTLDLTSETNVTLMDEDVVLTPDGGVPF